MLATFLTDRLSPTFNAICNQASRARLFARDMAMKANFAAREVFDQIAPRATVRRYIAEQAGDATCKIARGAACVTASAITGYTTCKYLLIPTGEFACGLVSCGFSKDENSVDYKITTAIIGANSLMMAAFVVGMAIGIGAICTIVYQHDYAEWKQKELEAMAAKRQ